MKKLFTLLVGALFAGNAFGQELVTNGDCEGTMPADHYTYWVQDTRIDGVEEEPGEAPYQHAVTHSNGTKGWLGHADIVENPFGSGHCVKVHVASRAESEALGTARIENGSYVAWNTQFFVYMDQPVPEGKWLTLQMRVRCQTNDGSMSGQAHQTPGDYTHYTLFTSNDISYDKKKWNKVWRKAQVKSDHVKDGRFFQAVCFNLSINDVAESFDLYFDDISIVMSDEEPQQPEEPVVEDTSGFIDFLRKGIESDDSFEGDLAGVYNFMIQTPDKGIIKAPIETLEDGTRAIVLETMDYVTETTEEQVVDEDGNPVVDEETGEPQMKTVTTYKWPDGSLVKDGSGQNADGAAAPQQYSYQFFVTSKHKMKAGERWRFRIRAKADKPASFNNQGHSRPGRFVGWQPLGNESIVAFDTEWKSFEWGEVDNPANPDGNNGGKVPNGLNNCYTIAFDAYVLKEANKYYFIFDEYSFSDKNVTIGDRTLGEETINLVASNDPEAEQANTIDATNMLTIFDEKDFSFLEGENDGMKLVTMTQPEDPEEDPEETFSSLLPWTSGGIINNKGYFVDGDFTDGIGIRFDDESIDGNKVNINVYNDPEASGVTFAEGVTVPTQICVSSKGWYYIFNATLMDEATAAGIQGVKAVKVNNGLIYNLAGQRVDSSYKGLVIKNGQKAIQK